MDLLVPWRAGQRGPEACHPAPPWTASHTVPQPSQPLAHSFWMGPWASEQPRQPHGCPDQSRLHREGTSRTAARPRAKTPSMQREGLAWVKQCPQPTGSPPYSAARSELAWGFRCSGIRHTRFLILVPGGVTLGKVSPHALISFYVKWGN